LWFGIRLGSRSWCTRRRWRQRCWRWWWRSRRDWTSMSIGIQTNRKIHLEIVLCFEITLAVGWDENYLVGLQRGLSLSNYNKSSHQKTEFHFRQLLHLVTICIWNAWIRCCNSYLLNFEVGLWSDCWSASWWGQICICSSRRLFVISIVRFLFSWLYICKLYMLTNVWLQV
jgi:hypothetical protein